MNHSIWQIVANTPWWVFVLFIFLLKIGIAATKPQRVPSQRLYIFPLLFVALSAYNLYSSPLTWNLYSLGTLATAIISGIILGWIQFKSLKIKAIRETQSLYLPGTWSLLIIILMIFAVKYYMNYEMAIARDQFPQSSYAQWLLIISGLFCGLFVGRLLCAKRCLKVGPFLT